MQSAVRAIRDVHFSHGVWSAGAQWHENRPSPDAVNVGLGIELADERAVAARLSTEFVSSASRGYFVKADSCEVAADAGRRYWTIQREKVEEDDTKKSVDVVIRRKRMTDDYAQGKVKVDPPPAFIECKRYRTRKITDLVSGTADAAKQNIEGFKNDAEKLRKHAKDSYACWLVWGTSGGDDHADDSPIACLDKLASIISTTESVLLLAAEWIPLGWSVEDPTAQLTSAKLTVTRACWVALFELVVKDGASQSFNTLKTLFPHRPVA